MSLSTNKAHIKLIEYTNTRRVKKLAYGDQATDDMPSQVHGLKIAPKLEDFVKQWNKMRNDNVVTKQAEATTTKTKDGQVPNARACSPMHLLPPAHLVLDCGSQ